MSRGAESLELFDHSINRESHFGSHLPTEKEAQWGIDGGGGGGNTFDFASSCVKVASDPEGPLRIRTVF